MDWLNKLPVRRQFRIRARLVAILLGGAAAYFFAIQIQEKRYLWALIPGAALISVSIFEFVVADLLVDARFPRSTSDFLERLQTKLATTSTHEEILKILENCVRDFAGCDHSQISATVHLRVEVLASGEDAVQLGVVQISDYTKAGLGGRRWRVLETTKGLVGRCLRTEELVTANFATEADYRDKMVSEFGFTRAEVEKHTRAARSYLAFPIRSGTDVVGVMYFFSTEPQVFPVGATPDRLQEAAEMVAALLRASEIL